MSDRWRAQTLMTLRYTPPGDPRNSRLESGCNAQSGAIDTLSPAYQCTRGDFTVIKPSTWHHHLTSTLWLGLIEMVTTDRIISLECKFVLMLTSPRWDGVWQRCFPAIVFAGGRETKTCWRISSTSNFSHRSLSRCYKLIMTGTSADIWLNHLLACYCPGSLPTPGDSENYHGLQEAIRRIYVAIFYLDVSLVN